jgi:hypothetical protein
MKNKRQELPHGQSKMKNPRPAVTAILFTLVATIFYLGSPGSIARGQNAPVLPYGAGEVVKLYQGGIAKDVIISYINGNALSYHLNADGIIYFQKTLGMPEEITKAMLLRDGQLQQEAKQQQPQLPIQQPGTTPEPYGTSAPFQPPVQQVIVPATPSPAVTVIGTDYPPDYNYGYPYYPYGYGWPYFELGGGWGW